MHFHHVAYFMLIAAGFPQGASLADAGSQITALGDAQPANGASVGPTILDGAVLLLGVLAAWWVVRGRWHRLAHRPARAEGPSVAWLLLTLVAAFLAGRAALGVALLRLDVQPERAPNWLNLLELREIAILHGSSTLAQATLIVLALLAWRLVNPPASEALRADGASSHRPPDHWNALASGVSAILLAWPIAAACGLLAALAMHLLGVERTHIVAHETLERLLSAPRDAWFAAMMFVVVALVPVAEELLYRGVIQSMVIRMGLDRWPAIIITSAIFTAMHFQAVEPHALASLFALSLGLGLVYERTRSLLAPMALHAMFNAGNLLAALAGAGG